MDLTRRDLLRAGAVGGLAAAAPAAGLVPGTAHAAVAPARIPADAAARSVATLAQRLATGSPGAGGYRPVVQVAGEEHSLRTDLGVTPADGRAARRHGLLAFVQLSDVHVVDAQSPLRVEWVDRLDDPSSLPGTGLLSSSYRPQEMLSGHIAASMVAAINEVGTGPVTGRPFALAIQTGDNSDNSQRNEVRWNIDVLDGGTVRFDSGRLDRWEGVADDVRATYDRAYWHPHGTPAGLADDLPRSRYGFPVVPGLLDAVRRPFAVEGLRMPWYSVFGNHDGLVQGNFPRTLGLSSLATGNLKVFSPPLGLHPGALVDQLLADPLGLVAALGLTGGARLVSADRERRILTRKQVVEEHFATTGTPVGHGFTEANRSAGTAHYWFDQAGCRFVVLDTVNQNGYADGSLDKPQFEWLRGVLEQSAGRVVMVFSHHTSATMGNPLVGTGLDPHPRVLGPEVLALLLAHPEVVAWVNGHTHANRVTPHRRADGGGLWEITTASHIDWPQQARLVEVTDNDDGTLSIFTTMVDHAGPASGTWDLDDPASLAGLARELSANDWHDHGHGTGGVLDRNVELVVADPRP